MENTQQVQKKADEHSGRIIFVGARAGMNGQMSGREIGQRFANVGGRHGVNVAGQGGSVLGRGGSVSNRGRAASNGGTGRVSG